MLIYCPWSLWLSHQSYVVIFFQNSHLYYENTTGIYYYYDEPSGTYKFHSKIDLPNNPEKTVNDDKNDPEERENGEEYSNDEEENDKDLEGL